MRSTPNRLATIAAFLLIASLCRFGLAEAPSASVDFENDVIPLLTKHGCNSGACHGAAIGRGGFKLSLYGGNPEADYAAITREIGGRRINLAHPDRSLLMLKPCEMIEHGGGTIFETESESARLLSDWIKQGAPTRSERRLARVEFQPRRHVDDALRKPVRLRVTAHYDDGSQRDVTKWTVFKAEDAAAIKLEQQTARVLRPGRHIIVARYLNEVVPLEFIVPLTSVTIDLTEQPRHNFIDDEILDSLEMLGVRPSASVDDAVFLRRLTLDLTGRLPSPEAVEQFLADQRDDKRQILIERLLASDEFTEYWTLQLAKWMRVRPPDGDLTATRVYHRWLANQVRDGVSYKQIARDLLTATGDTHENGPANFYRTTKNPREQAEFVSELLMGSRLRCANCHNHPLDRWTQDDYHGLAAIFAKIENGRVVQTKRGGEVIHPRTLAPAAPRIPGEGVLNGDDNARKQLADWLTDAKNPYFAKAIVNRLWKRMMGRGLVEPVDDFRATNPATHPALLDKLAEDFIQNGYRLRPTLHRIASSAAYARSAKPNKQNRDDDRFYSHAAMRPLEPEVLADAISDVLGVAEEYGEEPDGMRAVALVSPTTPSRTLDVLGRCDRVDSCESDGASAGGLARQLHLFNGALLNARIAAEGGRLRRMQNAGREPGEIIDQFYVLALGRHPNASERDHWKKQLDASPDRTEFLEDFVWGLLTSKEFVTNH